MCVRGSDGGCVSRGRGRERERTRRLNEKEMLGFSFRCLVLYKFKTMLF